MLSDSHSEEARAFLQSRLALFWKVLFFLVLLSVAVEIFNVLFGLGPASYFTVGSALEAGAMWWIFATGTRSIRQNRILEALGLFGNTTLGMLGGRYTYLQLTRDFSISGDAPLLMTDSFATMLLLGGASMMFVMRAALIPSTPKLAALVTAWGGLPLIVMPAFIVPNSAGILQWRGWDTEDARHLLPLALMMWAFSVLVCGIISWVVHGLREQVREARRLGQYVLERKIGAGGMGQVYRARHGLMRRPTAIKLVQPNEATPESIRRFEQEVQSTAQLTHPNTITVFDFGRTSDGVFYYAMELLDGLTLAKIVALSGKQPPARVLHLLDSICGALGEAHDAGLIHRDIKPENIMLCRQGGLLDFAKVLDFGLVKQLDVGSGTQLTGVNVILGTPQYMAPEAILSPEKVDERTDIYSLGAVAYFLLSGKNVFRGASVVEVCGQHLHETPVPLAAHTEAVPADMERIVLDCLSKDPARRPQNVRELRERLSACHLPKWTQEDAQTWWSEYSVLAQNGGSEVDLTIAVRRS